MQLKSKFNITKRRDLKQWHFNPAKGIDAAPYVIPFDDAATSYDAWILLWKAEMKKAVDNPTDDFDMAAFVADKPIKPPKRQLTDEWNSISEKQGIFTVHLVVEFANGNILHSSGALEIAGLLSSICGNYDEYLSSYHNSVIRWKYYIDTSRAEAISSFNKQYHQDAISIKDIATANMIYYSIAAIMFVFAAVLLLLMAL